MTALINLFVFFLTMSISLKTKTEPCSTVCGEIVGLNKFNLIKHMQNKPGVSKLLFSKYNLIKWILVQFVKVLQIDFSRPR